MSKHKLRLLAVPLAAASWLLASCSEKLEKSDDDVRADQASEQQTPNTVVSAPTRTVAHADAQTTVSLDPATPPPEVGPTAKSKALPCEVAAIVDEHCASCHVADGSAPMALTSAEDFQREAGERPMRALVKQKLNASDPREAMPPAGYDRLAANELATLNRWLDLGAPEGDEKCSSAPRPDAGTPGTGADALGALADDDLTCYPLLAHNGDNETPYAVGVATDAYVAFTFAAPWQETAYAVRIRPLIDNSKVIHHWILFQDDVPGTPGGAEPEPFTGIHPDKQMIAAWAPGADPLDFRHTGADVGLELPHDTTYTLEFHYNSSDPAATDRSGVEVCTYGRKPAQVAGYSWLGSQNFLWPSTSWTGACQPSSKEPIHILTIMPHMHYKGIHMKVTLNHAKGSQEVIHDGDFDFNYERVLPVNLTLQPGDSLTTDCTYSEPSTYGPRVVDEMCYLFTVAYPKGALVSPDLIGGVIHNGYSCLGE
jgi:mono/diheme cytochrome c family protein